MILMGQGMGMVIEAWKVRFYIILFNKKLVFIILPDQQITKAVDIKMVPAPPGALIPYKLDIKDKHVLSEDEKKTQE